MHLWPWAGAVPSPAQADPTAFSELCWPQGKKVKSAASHPSSASYGRVLWASVSRSLNRDNNHLIHRNTMRIERIYFGALNSIMC